MRRETGANVHTSMSSSLPSASDVGQLRRAGHGHKLCYGLHLIGRCPRSLQGKRWAKGRASRSFRVTGGVRVNIDLKRPAATHSRSWPPPSHFFFQPAALFLQ
jgi:hypothetical protein